MIEIENLPNVESPREILRSRFASIDELPIQGGWGYSMIDAVVVDKNDPIVNKVLPFNGVEVEYIFARYRTYLELITQRDKDDRFSGIDLKLNFQETHSGDNGRKYDRLIMDITAFRDQDFNELKQDWENNFHKQDFDHEAHEKKREEKLVHIQREFWFEISSFYGQDFVDPRGIEKKKTLLTKLAVNLSEEQKREYLKDDKIIEHFFIKDYMIEGFKTRDTTGIISENGKWFATLTKVEPSKWLYELRLGNGTFFLGEHLHPFELTEENINLFDQGVSAISHMYEEYLITGVYDESLHPFGRLTYETSKANEIQW